MRASHWGMARVPIELAVVAALLSGCPGSGDGDDGASSTDGGTDGLPYAACDGDPFFPAGCTAGACATAGLSARIYGRWRTRMIATYGIDAAGLDAHVEVSAIELVADRWRIDYVYVIDWVRSRNATTITVDGADPTDESIDAAIDLQLDPTAHHAIASVVALDTVEAAVADCASGLGMTDVVIDACHIRFENVTGLLQVHARGVIDADANRCGIAQVDVETGVGECREDACTMD